MQVAFIHPIRCQGLSAGVHTYQLPRLIQCINCTTCDGAAVVVVPNFWQEADCNSHVFDSCRGSPLTCINCDFNR